MVQQGGAWTAPIPKKLLHLIQAPLQFAHTAVAGLRYGATFLQGLDCVLQPLQLCPELLQHLVPLTKARVAGGATGKVLPEAPLALVTAPPREASPAQAVSTETVALQGLRSCWIALTCQALLLRITPVIILALGANPPSEAWTTMALPCEQVAV